MAPPREIGGRQHGEPRAWIHIGIGTGGQGAGVRTDDLWEGGIVRQQPVCMWLREGPISQWFGRGSRRVGCVHLVARLAHWTRAAEGRPPVRDRPRSLPPSGPLGGSPLDGLLGRRALGGSLACRRGLAGRCLL